MLMLFANTMFEATRTTAHARDKWVRRAAGTPRSLDGGKPRWGKAGRPADE